MGLRAGVPIDTGSVKYDSMKIFMLMFGVGVSVLCSLDNWRLVSLFKAV